MRLNFSKLVIPALFLVQCRVSGGWDLVSVQGGTETNVTDVIVNEFPILGGIEISFIRVGGFFGFIGKGLQIAGQIFGFVHQSRENHRAAEQLETNFRQVFGSLDRNFQAIANTREAIDLMMTKSLAAVAGLGQKLDQSTAQILGELGKIDQKVDRNFAYLLKIFKIASETFTAVETTRYEMHEEFAQVLNFVKSSKIEPVITKLNNFVTYFSSETMRISRLTRDERIATLLDENGFIRYLRESRTPKGESLQTAMFEITDRGFAVPKNTNDSMAFAALSSLYFGVKTQISVMRYLTTVNIYLADDAYRKRDLEKFNVHMENLEADHWAFSDTLVGSTDKKGLISSIIELLKKANTLSFGGAKSVNLTERAESLAQDKIKLQETTLPIIQDVPGKLIGTLKFGKGSQHTPIGNWKNGVKVSYAIQYMDQDLYSKVGEWSDPFHVDGLANPRLRIPAHSTFTRLIFRRFDNEAPQFVGRLERGSHGDFWDIDRDLYDAAMGADETKAEIEVNKLIENGANASTMFDLGKRALHGAALSGNAKLAGMYLLGDPNSVYIQDVNGYTPLHVAAENGWTDFITLMMQYGSDLNAKTKAGSTPLHLAVSNGFPKAVQVLLKNQAVNVNAQDIDGATPLHKAVLNGDADVLRLLLADERVNANLVSSGNISPLHLSAAVNTPGIVGELTKMSAIRINALATGNISALHIATMTGNMEVMRDLLSLDATNANGKSVNGWSPLHYALALKRDSSVSELLQAGKIDVNVLADGQISPLHIAAASGPTTWLNVLISRGAAVDLPNEDGFTALHIAAINNNMDGVALLVSKNANVNARTANGSTILHLMANCGNEGIIKYILGTGKSIVSARNNVGETALELAEKKNEAGVASLLKNATLSLDTRLVVAAGKGNLTDVQSAVAGGANINVLTPQKDTPLTKAASSGNLAVVKFLVERGAVVNTRGTAGASTPLHLAAGTGHLDIVKYLVEQGADVKARDTNDFETPLGYACASGRQDVVEFLVGKGSEVNAKTCDGGTPLIIATFKGFLNVAKFLVEHGADVNVKKIDGSTPLSIANATKHADIAAYLTSKGAK